MKSLMQLVHEGHVVTETDHGNYCWTCTLAAGTDTPHPCPTLTRAKELDALNPLKPKPPEPTPPPAEKPSPADPATTPEA